MEKLCKVLAILVVILAIACLALGIVCCWMGELLLLFQVAILGTHTLIFTYAISSMIDTYIYPHNHTGE